ncbi:MAG: hypothetical protein ABIJ22_01010 [Patescibacteria group bacterium]
MKNLFKKKVGLLDKTASFLHLKKEKPRDKYLKIALKILLFVSIFLAGYLVAKLEFIFNLI